MNDWSHFKQIHTLLSLRIPRCDDDDDDDVEFNGNVLYCICCGRICKLREEYEFLAAELSREPCCEPLLETGPSGWVKGRGSNKKTDNLKKRIPIRVVLA